MSFQLGDILYAKSEHILHPFIFLGEYQGNYLGTIISHNPGHNNISLAPNHFKETDNNGDKYQVQYENSFFAKNQLIKDLDWADYKKVGQLTEDGIEFVMSYVKDIVPDHYFNITSFKERIERTKK